MKDRHYGIVAVVIAALYFAVITPAAASAIVGPNNPQYDFTVAVPGDLPVSLVISEIAGRFFEGGVSINGVLVERIIAFSDQVVFSLGIGDLPDSSNPYQLSVHYWEGDSARFSLVPTPGAVVLLVIGLVCLVAWWKLT